MKNIIIFSMEFINPKIFRKMTIKLSDYYLYKISVGELICYPAFTWISEKDISKYKCPTVIEIGINGLTINDISIDLIINIIALVPLILHYVFQPQNILWIQEKKNISLLHFRSLEEIVLKKKMELPKIHILFIWVFPIKEI